MSKRLKSHTERLRQEVAIGSINDQEVKQIVFRQPEVVKAIQDLKEVFGKLLVKVYNQRAIDPDQITERLLGHVERLRPMVTDISRVLNDALDADKVVLFEGAQAHHLAAMGESAHELNRSGNPDGGNTRDAGRNGRERLRGNGHEQHDGLLWRCGTLILCLSPRPDAPLTDNFGEHGDLSEALVISQTNGYDVSQH